MPTDAVPFAPPAEQFIDGEQQRQAVTLGMWIFLATEVLFFGGLLVAYSAYRIWYPNDFAAGSRHLDFLLGTLNTAILLTSSFTMAGAVAATQLLDRKSAMALLVLTVVCGTCFIAIKGHEWATMIHEGLWPGVERWASPSPTTATHLFYSLYFIMTGLHALHLLAGIGFLLGTIVGFWQMPAFLPNQNRFTLLGLYWHFVDIVWIFLYPLLYFIGRSS